MPVTVPVSKPEHKLMKKSNAGGSFGVGFENDDRRFSLVPSSAINNRRLRLLMLSVVIGSYPVLIPAINQYALSVTERMIGYALIGICGLVIAGAILFVAHVSSNESGTLMVVDKASGDVWVPNENKAFRRSQIEHLQLIAAPGTGNFALMVFFELNLIAKIGEARVRVPIAGELDDFKLVEHAIKSLIDQTELPIYYYKIIRQKGGDQIEIGDVREAKNFFSADVK